MEGSGISGSRESWPDAARKRLRVLANTAVSVPLGLGGQSILWKNLLEWKYVQEHLQDFEELLEIVHWIFFLATIVALVLFCTLYTMKAALCRNVVLAEFRHPLRCNFFAGPCIALCMLALSKPLQDSEDFDHHQTVLRVLWYASLVYQILLGLLVYHRWLYTSSALDLAATPYLLSLVSWFLLSALGTPAAIDDHSGLPLRAMCFGIGCFFSLFTYPFVLLGIHAKRAPSPALFLIIAPPAVAAIALSGLAGEVNSAVEAIFGSVVFFLLLLLRSGPVILARPVAQGVYWAYVFPTAAVATLSMRVDAKHRTRSTEVLTIALVSLALLAFFLVASRMAAFTLQVWRGHEHWSDPLAMAAEVAPEAAPPPEAAQKSKVDGDARVFSPATAGAVSSVVTLVELENLVARLDNLEAAVNRNQSKLGTYRLAL